MRDFDILRLLRWCRFLSVSTLRQVFTQAELSNLYGAGLIKQHPGSRAYILTGKGSRLLDSACGGSILPCIQKSYRDSDIRRRLHISAFMLTAYQAGFQVFTTGLEELVTPPAIFLPSNSRGRGMNPWANTRIAAVAALGGTLCAVHHIHPDAGRLLLTDELSAFSRNTAVLRTKQQAFLFVGNSYGEILAELERPDENDNDRFVCYGEAYRTLTMPAHLVACDSVGAMQLQIMAQPDYRPRLTRLALRSKYEPAAKGFPECDALFQGAPFFMAADMDLRRLDKAIQTVRQFGGGPIVLAALSGQAEALLYARYRDTGLARVFTLTEAALKEFFSGKPSLYAPPRHQFLTAKGDIIDAPLIQTHRKVRGPPCK